MTGQSSASMKVMTSVTTDITQISWRETAANSGNYNCNYPRLKIIICLIILLYFLIIWNDTWVPIYNIINIHVNIIIKCSKLKILLQFFYSVSEMHHVISLIVITCVLRILAYYDGLMKIFLKFIFLSSKFEFIQIILENIVIKNYKCY